MKDLHCVFLMLTWIKCLISTESPPLFSLSLSLSLSLSCPSSRFLFWFDLRCDNIVCFCGLGTVIFPLGIISHPSLYVYCCVLRMKKKNTVLQFIYTQDNRIIGRNQLMGGNLRHLHAVNDQNPNQLYWPSIDRNRHTAVNWRTTTCTSMFVCIFLSLFFMDVAKQVCRKMTLTVLSPITKLWLVNCFFNHQWAQHKTYWSCWTNCRCGWRFWGLERLLNGYHSASVLELSITFCPSLKAPKQLLVIPSCPV